MLRTFASISKKEFAMRFLAVLMEDDPSCKKQIIEIFNKQQDYEKTLYKYMGCTNCLYSDVFNQFLDDIQAQVDVDIENHHCDQRSSKIIRLHTLDNGFTFLGMWVGGDWEVAVTVIMYWNGNDFRGYVPKDGNCWNYINNKAFWNDTDEDWKYLKQYCPSKAQEIEQKAQGQQEPLFYNSREEWLGSSDWTYYDLYFNLVDEDKMLAEIKQVFP